MACTIILGRNPNYSIGSFDHKTITVPQEYSSVGNTHCKISVRNGSYYIKNIKATYGTWIDGMRLHDNEEKQVFSYNKILLGSQKGPQFQIDFGVLDNICKEISKPPMDLHYASWGARLGGYLLDGIFMNLALVPLIGILMGMYMLAMDTKSAGIALMIYFIGFIGLFLIIHFYYVVQLNKHGRTLGKRIAGVRVLDAESKRYPTKLQAWGRYLSYIISGLILYIGFFLPLWTKKKQALHDFMAGTIVVQDEK